MNRYEIINKKVLEQIEQGKHINPMKLIRLKCLSCMAFDESEVRKCEIEDCVLFRYRFGKNPVKRVLSEKQKKTLSENMKKLQAKRRQR